MTLSKKISIIGPFGVGKTSLFRRFIDDEFSEDYKVTLGVQIKKKQITLPDNRTLSMILWDTEGHTDSVQETRESYLLGSHAFIYVFDVTRPETYQNLNIEVAYLKRKYQNIFVKVIGNKLDLVKEKNIRSQFQATQTPFDYLTSAKKNKNISELFYALAEELTPVLH